MASQSKGIQQLLQAEKRAADLVSEARKRKTKRLKEAKEEARAEIDGFRGERERQFRVYQKEHMGSKDDFEAKIEEQTRARLDKVSQDVASNKEAVIERILNLVYDIKPEVHENLRL